MLKASCLALAMHLIPASLLAQELATASFPPLTGELMVQSGTFRAQRSTVDGEHCPEGEAGRRSQTTEIRFDPPYREPPQVFLNLNLFEFAENRNARIGSSALNVTRDSMLIAVWTWCDTNMYAAAGTYFAIGQLGEIPANRPSQIPLVASEQPRPPIALAPLGPPPPFEGPGIDPIDDW